MVTAKVRQGSLVNVRVFVHRRSVLDCLGLAERDRIRREWSDDGDRWPGIAVQSAEPRT